MGRVATQEENRFLEGTVGDPHFKISLSESGSLAAIICRS